MSESSCGAYILTHVGTGLFYIGSTGDLTTRAYEHERLLRKGEHRISTLQIAFDVTPSISFQTFPAADREEAFRLEQNFLDRNFGSPLILNVATDAKYSSKGTQHSDDHKEKIRQSLIGTKHTEDAKTKISERLTGVCSPCKLEHLKQLNATQKGVPLSEAHKSNLSSSLKGREISDEHRAKISDALLGRKQTAEHRENVANARVGFKHTPETKARIAETLRSKKKR